MGSNMFPAIYGTIEEARTAAEGIFDALERYPHRRPHTIQVVDVWTRETVTRVYPPSQDPFAPNSTTAVPSPGSVTPPSAAEGHTGTGPTDNAFAEADPQARAGENLESRF